MRIYEEPFTVHEILRKARVEQRSSTGRTLRVVEGINLNTLNKCIAEIPKQKIQKQRQIYTLFYEECLVSADKDYGVEFGTVLLVLAHYKIINDNKSLK